MRSVEGTITDPAMDRLLFGDPKNKAPMTLDEYQASAEETAVYPRVYTEQQVRQMLIRAYVRGSGLPGSVDADLVVGAAGFVDFDLDQNETEFSRLVYPVLGLVGEAGEVANKLKKVARDKGGVWEPDMTQDYVAELGDIAWYVAAVATGLKTKLGTIASKNIEKLFSRRDRGVLGGSGDNR